MQRRGVVWCGVGYDERCETVRRAGLRPLGPWLPALCQVLGGPRVIDGNRIILLGAGQPDRGRGAEAIVGQPVPVVGTLETEPLLHGGFVQTYALDG